MIHVNRDKEVIVKGSGTNILAELSIVFCVLMKEQRNNPKAIEKIKVMLKSTVDFAADLTLGPTEDEMPSMAEGRETIEKIFRGGRHNDN